MPASSPEAPGITSAADSDVTAAVVSEVFSLAPVVAEAVVSVSVGAAVGVGVFVAWGLVSVWVCSSPVALVSVWVYL